jgi:hypothetical protein
VGDAEFLLGLVAQDGSPCATQEDFDSPHGVALRRWQDLGVVGREAAHLRAAGCPHCDEGVPHLVGGRYLCNVCWSRVDPAYLLVWAVDLRAFLGHLAALLRLHGGVRPVGEYLWQLGTGQSGGEPVECFYSRRGNLTAPEQQRLRAYRRLLAFHGPLTTPGAEPPARWVPLVELFGPDGLLVPRDLAALLRSRGRVRFEADSGTLWVGDARLGEVPLGSREHCFLVCLHEQLDRYVPYADLKREVLRRTGGTDGTEEATFCQKLKSRIKVRYIAGIDTLIVTSNKGDGYRLRAEGEA